MTETKQHMVELVRYSGPEQKYSNPDRFDRGERIIMVDGVRWGRTRVMHHGMHGTSHQFVQEGGETLMDGTDRRYPPEIEVHSKSKRYLRSTEEWRPTEERVLEKARELVADGRLRDPKIVKAEQAEAQRHYRERKAKQEADEKKLFRARACEALGINQDDGSQIIDRVIAAMRWAQTQ